MAALPSKLESVESWLQALNMAKYVPAFEAAGVTSLGALRQVRTLKEAGVTSRHSLFVLFFWHTARLSSVPFFVQPPYSACWHLAYPLVLLPFFLRKVTDASLKEAGVTLAGHRKRLLLGIGALDRDGAPPRRAPFWSARMRGARPPPSVAAVPVWLRSREARARRANLAQSCLAPPGYHGGASLAEKRFATSC